MSKDELNHALIVAAIGNNVEGVVKLLRKGARIDTASHDGFQPLHFAALHGGKEAAELLIARGAKVDARTNDGSQPLHLAAVNGRKEIALLLLAQMADPLALNNKGQTPYGCLCNNREIRKEMEALLEVAEREWKDPALRERRAMAEHLARQRKLGALRQKGPAL